MINTSLRRPLAALIVSALVAAVSFVATPAQATADFQFDRVSGSDRYATAAAIALDAFPGGATAAIIATGENFPDALAGSFFAGRDTGFPILLVQQNSVPAVTDQALQQLGVTTVVLLGGSTVISDGVQTALDADYDVFRLGGTDRFDTARMIAETAAPADIGQVGTKSTAIIASGFGFADALAAGPVSYAQRLPILLTGPEGLAGPSKSALERLEIEHVLVIGGTSVISPTVESEIQAMGITTDRIAGGDRFETATKVADFAIDELGFDDTHFNLAKGIDPTNSREGFADALAGAPHAGEEQSVVVLTAPDQLSPVTRTWIESRSDTLANGHIFGGNSAVQPGVEAAAVAAARNVAGEVVRFNKTDNFYLYVPAGGDAAAITTYTSEDTFFVDGVEATVGVFEGALQAGDLIKYESGAQPVHRLTNVADSAINGRTIGNVDTGDDEFDFISDVTGDSLRGHPASSGRPDEIKYNVAGAAYNITGKGAGVTVADFEEDLNEGDVVTISADGKTFTLTNKSVVGRAFAVEAQPSGQSFRRFRIEIYGDIHDKSSDSSTDSDGSGNDDKYRADGPTTLPPTSGDAFGGEAANYSEFHAELTEGDLISYTREDGVETFALDNEALPTLSGTAKSISKNGDAVDPTNDGKDGGSVTFTLPDGTDVSRTYVNNSDQGFVVDGKLATEAEFEAAYTAGDKIVFTPKDQPAAQEQRIELTNVSG